MGNERITLTNSTVEFVVIGARGGQDVVIAQSANAGLDLLGLAIESGNDATGAFDLPISFFAGPPRQLNVVISHPVKDLEPSVDSRESRMRFAWVGECSGEGRRQIGEFFNRIIVDLQEAIRQSNYSQTELVIAPLIWRCSRGSERRLRVRRLFYLFVATYGFVLFMTLFVWLILQLRLYILGPQN